MIQDGPKHSRIRALYRLREETSELSLITSNEYETVTAFAIMIKL